MSQHVEGTERKRSEAKVWVIGVLVAVAVLLAAWLVYRASNAAFSDDAQVGGSIETVGVSVASGAPCPRIRPASSCASRAESGTR